MTEQENIDRVCNSSSRPSKFIQEKNKLCSDCFYFDKMTVCHPFCKKYIAFAKKWEKENGEIEDEFYKRFNREKEVKIMTKEEMIEYEKNHTLLYWYHGEIMTKEELYRRIKND